MPKKDKSRELLVMLWMYFRMNATGPLTLRDIDDSFTQLQDLLETFEG